MITTVAPASVVPSMVGVLSFVRFVGFLISTVGVVTPESTIVVPPAVPVVPVAAA